MSSKEAVSSVSDKDRTSASSDNRPDASDNTISEGNPNRHSGTGSCFINLSDFLKEPNCNKPPLDIPSVNTEYDVNLGEWVDFEP